MTSPQHPVVRVDYHEGGIRLTWPTPGDPLHLRVLDIAPVDTAIALAHAIQRVAAGKAADYEMEFFTVARCDDGVLISYRDGEQPRGIHFSTVDAKIVADALLQCVAKRAALVTHAGDVSHSSAEDFR